MSEYYKNWKKDVVDEAQQVMNANKSLDNKNLISALTNEIIACRAEIERLELRYLNSSSPMLIKSLHVTFDRDGKVDFIESKKYG